MKSNSFIVRPAKSVLFVGPGEVNYGDSLPIYPRENDQAFSLSGFGFCKGKGPARGLRQGRKARGLSGRGLLSA
jgi:hypothetical protein